MSVRNAPMDMLKKHINPSLKFLHKDFEGEDNNIFPERAFFSTRSAMQLGFYLRR